MKKRILVAAVFAAVFGFCAVQPTKAAEEEKGFKIAGLVLPPNTRLRVKAKNGFRRSKTDEFVRRTATAYTREEGPTMWCWSSFWHPTEIGCGHFSWSHWDAGKYTVKHPLLYAYEGKDVAHTRGGRDYEKMREIEYKHTQLVRINKTTDGKLRATILKPKYLRSSGQDRVMQRYLITDISPSNRYVIYLKKIRDVPGVEGKQVLLGIDKVLSFEKYRKQ